MVKGLSSSDIRLGFVNFYSRFGILAIERFNHHMEKNLFKKKFIKILKKLKN
jgi:hypothetical protein